MLVHVFIIYITFIGLLSIAAAEQVFRAISESKMYLGELFFNTKPNVGRNQATLYIYYAKSGKPVNEKLFLEVVPWMSAHEHGSSEIPKVSIGTQSGQYKLTNLTFTMPGKWQIYVKIKDKNQEDVLSFDITVEK